MRLLAQAAYMSPLELQHTERFANWLLNVGDGSMNNENNEIDLPPSISPFSFVFLFPL